MGEAVPPGDARYGGTRLLKDVGAARIHVTVDTWESPAAYEEFRAKFAERYAEIDGKCEGVADRGETFG